MNLDKGDTRLIIEYAKKKNVLRNQLAYILATADIETNYTMEPVKEAYWLGEGWRKANLRYYPYYGRGYVQLTWDYNYRKASEEYGIDALRYPDKVLEPEVAKRTLVDGMMEGWFTGKKLPSFVDLNSSDYVGARTVVNGTDRRHDFANLAKKYEKALLDEGYGVEKQKQPDYLEELIEWFKNLFS